MLRLDKHTVPNLIALGLVLLSFAVLEPWRTPLRSVGLFALSGALTNWIAIHMLFERVPGLYGSGIIVTRFEDFKASILTLVRERVFSPDKVERILANPDTVGALDLGPLVDKLDMDAAFDQLVATVLESPLGGMLTMFGGESALEKLRDPFRRRMARFLTEAASSPRIQQAFNQQVSSMAGSEAFLDRLDHVLRARLDELTPEIVRDMIRDVIRDHLGWLVVWGAVFGGMIGLLTALAGWQG